MNLILKISLTVLGAVSCFQLYAQLTIGSEAPELRFDSVVNKEGEGISSIKDFREEILIIDFWATWCSPCVGSIPELNELYRKYRNQGVNFLSITDDSSRRLTNFLETTEIDYWIGRDENQDIINAYGVVSRPTYFIINRMGLIVYKGNGINEEIIDEVIATDAYDDKSIYRQSEIEDFLIVNGGFMGGDDPVYNAVRLMGGQENLLDYDRIYQFIIRPSLEKEFGGYGYRSSKTYIGLTYSGGTLSELVFFLKNLSSPLRVINKTSYQDDLFDIVYWKPSSSLQFAQQEVLEELCNGLSFNLDSLQVETQVLTLKNEGTTVVTRENIKFGTEKTYLPLPRIASLLEEKLGEFCEIYGEEEELYIPVEVMEYISDSANTSRQEIIDYLLSKGVRVLEEKKTITIYELNNL